MAKHEAITSLEIYKRAGQQVILLDCFSWYIFYLSHILCVTRDNVFFRLVAFLISMKPAKDWNLQGIFNFLF